MRGVIRRVELSPEQSQTLTELRDHHPKPYLREKGAAILKGAAGRSMRQVALHGLLQERDPETIAGWLDRYEQTGIGGLFVQPGRGRPPAFSP
jgi:transposase